MTTSAEPIRTQGQGLHRSAQDVPVAVALQITPGPERFRNATYSNGRPNPDTRPATPAPASGRRAKKKVAMTVAARTNTPIDKIANTPKENPAPTAIHARYNPTGYTFCAVTRQSSHSGRPDQQGGARSSPRMFAEEEDGGPPGIRTPNLRIKSPLLCRVELEARRSLATGIGPLVGVTEGT